MEDGRLALEESLNMQLARCTCCLDLELASLLWQEACLSFFSVCFPYSILVPKPACLPAMQKHLQDVSKTCCAIFHSATIHADFTRHGQKTFRALKLKEAVSSQYCIKKNLMEGLSLGS